MQDTETTAQWTAQALKIRPTEVLVASTGVIGQPLPMVRVRQGIRRAAQTLSRTGSHLAAEAILTTDTRPKEFALRISTSGHPITIGGIAKGSGMVAPEMATILCFLTTDARVDRVMLQRLIRQAVNESFNRITVDGQTSTNDMVLILANGSSKAGPLRPGSLSYRNFEQGLKTVCRYLAHEIVRDGEGVTRLMKVQVAGAHSEPEARRVAYGIADSMLVKTMVAGRDPNWGRVAAAVGASGCRIDPNRLTIRLGKATVFRKGEPVGLSRKRLLKQVDHSEVQIGVDLGIGSGTAQLLSGDLTEEYIRINAKYTS
jgi:glutamate N-acetyltransferase/amino-acid N-acetyltransferase